MSVSSAIASSISSFKNFLSRLSLFRRQTRSSSKEASRLIRSFFVRSSFHRRLLSPSLSLDDFSSRSLSLSEDFSFFLLVDQSLR